MTPEAYAENFYSVCSHVHNEPQDGCAVLLSFQNSGNHLVRAAIEYLYGRPTLGVAKNKYNDKPLMFQNAGFICLERSPIAVKAHKILDIFDALTDGHPLNGRLLLIVRNPVDVIISKSRWLLHPLRASIYTHQRYVAGGVRLLQNTVYGRCYTVIQRMIRDYLDILAFFFAYKGKKEVIFFEDLIAGVNLNKISNLVSDESLYDGVRFEDIEALGRNSLSRSGATLRLKSIPVKKSQKVKIQSLISSIVKEPQYEDALAIISKYEPFKQLYV